VLGGASVAGLDEGAAAGWLALAAAVAWAAACGVGRTVPWLPPAAVARARLGRCFPGAEADGAEDDGEVVAAGAAVLSPAVVWAGAARANRVAKPTAVTALS
jgi:hypothetical protein